MNNLIKKGIAFAVILLFITVSVIPSTGTVIEKSSIISFDGNTLYVGGSGPGNYTTIQAAIDDADWGDTVFVFDDSSPYYETIELHKSIYLIGEDRDTTIIDSGFDNIVISLSGEDVTICGFTIRKAAIGILGSTNNSHIFDNIFKYCASGSIVLFYSSKNIISYNTVIESDVFGIGIYLGRSDSNTISDNTIKDHWQGILLERSNKNKIFKNTITGIIEYYGIELDYSFFNIIRKNNFIDNNCSAYFRTSILNFWMRNYWDDWDGSGPNRIRGEIVLSWDPYKAIPWVNFDWRPAREPYNIPAV